MKVKPPTPRPAAADAVIVIFGAAVRPDGRPSETLRYRVEAAARFGQRFASPLFIPTGAKGRHGLAESTVMARMLMNAGFSAATILEEPTGTDTLSSVRAVARMVSGHRRVFACTSAYHLPRCLLLLRLAGVAGPSLSAARGPGGNEPAAALVLAAARNPRAALRCAADAVAATGRTDVISARFRRHRIQLRCRR